MSGAILGGIGLGLQRGVQFMQNKDVQDAQLKMQQESHNAQMDRNSREKAEYERQQALAGVWQKYGDADFSDPDQFGAFSKEAIPLMSPQEIAATKQSAMGLKRFAGANAVDRFLYNNGDLSGFQEAVAKKQPGATVTKEGDNIVVATPDGKKQSMGSVKGMIAMFGIDGALERMQAAEAATIESEKTRAAINKDKAAAGYYNDRGRASLISAGAKGSGGSGSSSKKSGGAAVESGARTLIDIFDGKPNDAQKFVMEGIGDQGLEIQTEDGPTYIGKEEAGRAVYAKLDNLVGANPSLSVARAREIAVDMVRAENGGAPESGMYKPTPVLDPNTLQWKTAIRSKDGVVATYPEAVIQPTPEEVFKQESDVATQLVDSGESVELQKALADPERRKKMVQALRDPALARAIEAQNPGVIEKFKLLYAYTGLGGMDVPDIGLQQKRAQVQEMRKGEASRARRSATPQQEAAPAFSQEELEQSRKAFGVEPPKGITEQIGEAATAVGDAVAGAVSGVRDDLREGFAPVFERTLIDKLDSVRSSNYTDREAAASIIHLVRGNAERQKLIPEKELTAIEVLAGQRVK